MQLKTMDDLFVETLKDVYYAEKQIVKALPGMSKKAAHQELKQALMTHLKETEGQIERLEKVFEMLEEKPRAKKCEAIEGLIDEAEELMEHIDDEHVRDASMIGAAQAVEHYEISRYGTLVEWAKDLGHKDAAKLLQETLEEEKKTDKLLSEIARGGVNRDAEAAE